MKRRFSIVLGMGLAAAVLALGGCASNCKDGCCGTCGGTCTDKAACPNCKDGQMCEACKAKMAACPNCKDGQMCEACKAKMSAAH